MSRRTRTLGLFVVLTSFAAFPLWAASEGHFSIAIGARDNLLIQSPSGSTVADIAGETVGRSVTVGDISFEVSYGRDANGQLTAILASPGMSSVALHFSAGGKSIDADKAVVTLTFAADSQAVLVDPGYVGTVEVDSHLLRAHNLADDQPLPPSAVLTPTFTAVPTDATAPESTPATQIAAAAPAPAPTPSTSEMPVTPKDSSTPAPASDTTTVAATPEPAPMPDATTSPNPSSTSAPDSSVASSSAPAASSEQSTPGTTSLTSAPPMLASQLAPILPPIGSAHANSAPATSQAQPIRRSLAMTTVTSASGPSAPGGIQHVKLYWSEPITAPDGSAPVVATDEIKLVEVRGTVTVTEPNGTSQTGQEGMVVPSGSMVRTWDNASAALFMGGVNSARLMPKCELVVTQALTGSIRTDVVQLHTGAVFSRVGHRNGETENYSVTTPEGSSDAGATDMLAYRGTPADLRAVSTTRAGFVLDPKLLFAWNPAPSRGLISDVPLANMGIMTPIGNIPATYFYYTGGYRLNLNANAIRHEVLTNFSSNATPSNSEPDFVLQAIMTTLQPFNQKLNGLLKAINTGTETPAQLTYYHNLITIFFDEQAPGLVQDFLRNKGGFVRELNIDSAMLWQDLREFNLPSLTPH